MKTSNTPMSQQEIRRLLRSVGYSVTRRHADRYELQLNSVPITDHGTSDLAWKAAERHWRHYNT